MKIRSVLVCAGAACVAAVSAIYLYVWLPYSIRKELLEGSARELSSRGGSAGQRMFVDLGANDGRLERRQDLPPEAFFPADELRRLTEALGDDYGLLFAGLS